MLKDKDDRLQALQTKAETQRSEIQHLQEENTKLKNVAVKDDKNVTATCAVSVKTPSIDPTDSPPDQPNQKSAGGGENPENLFSVSQPGC